MLDAGPIDPRLAAVIVGHPGSLDARQAMEPLTEDAMWGTRDWERAFHSAAPIGQFTALPGLKLQRPERWSSYTVSDRNGIGPTTVRALELLPDWADGIERAALLYARWSKESSGRKRP